MPPSDPAEETVDQVADEERSVITNVAPKEWEAATAPPTVETDMPAGGHEPADR